MIVYSMLNQHNGKRYIGYTTQGLKSRRTRHLQQLKNGQHKNQHLQKMWNRGDRYLLWSILEVCSTIEEVTSAEMKWIAHHNTTNPSVGYNLTGGGDGAGIMLQATRDKISSSMMGHRTTPDTRAKLSVAHKGKSLTPSHRNKLSRVHKGQVPWNKGKSLTPEHRARIGESKKGQVPWNKSQ